MFEYGNVTLGKNSAINAQMCLQKHFTCTFTFTYYEVINV